jgi:hypothetical protein
VSLTRSPTESKKAPRGLERPLALARLPSNRSGSAEPMSKSIPMIRCPVAIAQAAGMDIRMPVAVRWSGDRPVRRRACPAGLTALSTAVRKRASNNYLLL